MKKEMRDYQVAKQNVDTFYANEKRLRAEEELKKKIRHRDKQAGQSSEYKTVTALFFYIFSL